MRPSEAKVPYQILCDGKIYYRKKVDGNLNRLPTVYCTYPSLEEATLCRLYAAIENNVPLNQACVYCPNFGCEFL